MNLTNIQKAKRAEMLKTLIQFNWNITQACKHLGIARSTFYRNAIKFNLIKPEKEKQNVNE